MRVTVIYHDDPDGVWAESPDVAGWTATAASLDELRARAEESIPFALDDQGVDTTQLEIDHRLPAAA